MNYDINIGLELKKNEKRRKKRYFEVKWIIDNIRLISKKRKKYLMT